MHHNTHSLSLPIPSSVQLFVSTIPLKPLQEKSPLSRCQIQRPLLCPHFTPPLGSTPHEWPPPPWNASLSWLLWHHPPGLPLTSLTYLSWSPQLAPAPLPDLKMLGLPSTWTPVVFSPSFSSSFLPPHHPPADLSKRYFQHNPPLWPPDSQIQLMTWHLGVLKSYQTEHMQNKFPWPSSTSTQHSVFSSSINNISVHPNSLPRNQESSFILSFPSHSQNPIKSARDLSTPSLIPILTKSNMLHQLPLPPP